MLVGRGPGASVCPGDRLFIPCPSPARLGSFLPQVWARQGKQDSPVWGSETLDMRLKPLRAGRKRLLKAPQAQLFPLLASPSRHPQLVIWPLLKLLG